LSFGEPAEWKIVSERGSQWRLHGAAKTEWPHDAFFENHFAGERPWYHRSELGKRAGV
jgi:hypothetical protein